MIAPEAIVPFDQVELSLKRGMEQAIASGYEDLALELAGFWAEYIFKLKGLTNAQN